MIASQRKLGAKTALVGMERMACSMQQRGVSTGWWLWLIVVATSGCTSARTWINQGFKVGPEYCPPGASLEVEWIDLQQDSRLSAESPPLAAWWYHLNDPLLNELVQAAYQQNLSLREAGARIEQAAAIRGVAEGNLFPQLQQAVFDYQSIQASRNTALPSPLRTFQEYGTGFAAAWELDFWGRFRRSVAAADALLDASVWDYDNVAVILLSDVAATYVEIRTLQRQIQIAEANIQSQTGSLKIAQALFQSGQTTKLDVNQAENNVRITESAIPVLEAQLRVANNRLCLLLGVPPRDLVAEWPEAPIPAAGSEIQAGIPADLLRRRPDIRRSERLVRAQSEQIGIAVADLYPRISLVGSFQWQAEDFNELFDSASVFTVLGPSVRWNILNYGRLQNSIRVEEARFREAVFRYQNDVLRAQQEVENAIVRFLKAKDTSTKLALAVAEADEAVSIVQAEYQAGRTDFNRVYLLESIRFVQQEQLVLSRANEVQSLIQLYRALGGGWEIRCPNWQPAGLESSGAEIEELQGDASPPPDTAPPAADALPPQPPAAPPQPIGESTELRPFLIVPVTSE